ncbi:hypothetical protein YG5714_2117 [Sulfolobus islandicus Y.G.57.14]|jgi:hypothetical protein|uniref:Uncharacterized protein n=10 Tax=Saccharolobus islandicus TaxID=43080 RepID=M9UGD6_SACIS|nr:hypothetical protein [Sulfolobus islandicus]ACP36144.1 hypothetical protein LS215_2157 [Sulfolobus islandicus L.S.2.15]ACP38733.1 hypothetical protein M1425_1992 [Sulfolobus islandicus M.14.25]ACP46367.1 hypothetical protein YG5714_2117 [Sulfolobus islandicus Y.G.57.14]ACP47928.1 hypothetical protein YN1551_0803 [Sulfolobus islandicus Y.N.15.51]ACP55937.1 hypothetical protein M1627_2070 [Sulfolobus islandicus M.16.27]
MMHIKLIFGPNGDMGLAKTIYNLKMSYPNVNAEAEFSLLCSTPMLQIGNKTISVIEYTDDEIIDLIVSAVTSHGKIDQLRESGGDIYQNEFKDFPPGPNFSEVLI